MNRYQLNGALKLVQPLPQSLTWLVSTRFSFPGPLIIHLILSTEGNYVLRGWPTGYQMFDHNKGPKDNPRHDAYLMGELHFLISAISRRLISKY
jgi:hypothetical protein